MNQTNTGANAPSADDHILVVGETCWRIETANRLRVIIDGESYFKAVKEAMLKASHTIMLIGWDFDTRIEFEPAEKTLDGPNQLGEFLSWLTRSREELDLYMLKWDTGAIQSVMRGMWPVALRPLRFSKNFHFRLDSEHPAGAAHHSKIIVIDDQLAFCGGIDMTDGRWDTCEHLDEQPCRGLPGNDDGGQPWHDATTAVSGPAAKALGDVARDRWQRASGHELTPPPKDAAPVWPDLDETLENVPMAISRTYPAFKDYEEVREIEALYLSAIAAAKDHLYIESQYLASEALCDAIEARLQEEEGPDIVIVLPQHAEGWLRKKAMDGARARRLRHLWDHDPHGHFAAFYPVTEQGSAIYVHAKVLIMDDELLRVGSSNLNNRSMGFDTECDIAVEANQCREPDHVRTTIKDLRVQLICEHLACEPDDLKDAYAAHGRLIGAIDSLRDEGRSLRPFSPDQLDDDESIVAENEFADPEEVGDGLGERLIDGIRDLFHQMTR